MLVATEDLFETVCTSCSPEYTVQLKPSGEQCFSGAGGGGGEPSGGGELGGSGGELGGLGGGGGGEAVATTCS